jgi:hypothetical protein
MSAYVLSQIQNQLTCNRKIFGLAMGSESRAGAIVARMGMREKIGQTSQGPMRVYPANDASRLEELFLRCPVGRLFVGGAELHRKSRGCVDFILRNPPFLRTWQTL